VTLLARILAMLPEDQHLTAADLPPETPVCLHFAACDSTFAKIRAKNAKPWRCPAECPDRLVPASSLTRRPEAA
jgi:hypothetical protein